VNSIQEAQRRPEYDVPGAPGFTIHPIINYIADPESGEGDVPTIVFRYILKLNGTFVDWFANEYDAQVAAWRNRYTVN
jgi:hypothetical protein